MAYCTNCGQQIEDDALFCPHCGAKQEAAQPTAPDGGAPGYGQNGPQAGPTGYGQSGPQAGPVGYGQTGGYAAAPKPPRKPMSKKSKIILGSVAGVVVALIVVVMVLRTVFSAENTVEQFLNSVRDQDYQAFSQVVVLQGDAVELTEESAAPFLALYSQEEYLEELQSKLNTAVYGGAQNGGMQLPAGDSTASSGGSDGAEGDLYDVGENWLTLEENNYLLFSTYKVSITPVKCTFWSNVEEADVSLAGQSVHMENGEVTVTVLPGVYDVTGTAPGLMEGAQLTSSLDQSKITYSGGSKELYFEFCTLYVQQISLEPSAILINGQPYTGSMDFEYGELTLSPLSMGDTVEVQYQSGDYTLSDSYTIDDTGAYFYPQPGLPDEAADAALEALGSYITQLVSGITAKDAAAITALTEGVDNGLLTSEVYNVKDNDDWYTYNYTLEEAYGDKKFSLNEDGQFSFDTLYYIHITGDYSSPYSTYDVDNEYCGYATLVYDETQGTWKVQEIWTSWWYDLEDLNEAVDLLA